MAPSWGHHPWLGKFGPPEWRRANSDRRLPIRKLARIAVVGVLLMASAPTASASTSRADSYFEVWCRDAGGNLVQAESVDAHAIELGHKDDAIALFNRNFPFGWTCWSIGPFTS